MVERTRTWQEGVRAHLVQHDIESKVAEAYLLHHVGQVVLHPSTRPRILFCFVFDDVV